MATILSLPIFTPQYFGFPYIITPEFKTLTTQSEAGRKRFSSVWTRPKRTIQLSGDGLTGAEIDIIEEFFMVAMGMGNGFYFEDVRLATNGLTKSKVVGEQLGVANGSNDTFNYQRTYTFGSDTSTFDVNYVKSSSTTVYDNGSVVSSSDYTNHIEKDSTNDAKILFNSPPTATHVITVDYTELIKCHFASDSLEIEYDAPNVYKWSMTLEEVLD